MFIDLENAVNEFEKYVSNYDEKNDKISRKIEHTLMVMKESKNVAESLKLSEEDVELASLIGLLHDIGRFEQAKQYDTFADSKSIDHGELGVKILFEQNMIRKFVKEDKYDEIIKTAIFNHNKNKIEDGLDDRKLLHSKIVRDADKIDIYRVILNNSQEAMYGCTSIDDEITEEILNDYLNHELIKYVSRKTKADILVCHLAFIYDLYFDYSVKVIFEKKYAEKIVEKVKITNLKTKKQINELVELINEYMKKRIS